MIEQIERFETDISAWHNTALNKIPGRYYWHYFLKQETIPKSLFYPKNIDIKEKIALFKKYVCIVNLETSTYCNRKCQYCPISLTDSRKKQDYMSDEIFNKILTELKSVNYLSTISFNLYNEPLADDNIYLRIEQARETLPNAFFIFNSNGDYINIDNLNKLQKLGLNALSVTLHPPVDKPYKVDDRIKDFQKLFKKIGLNANEYDISKPLENGHIESNINWHGMRFKVMANDWLQYGNSRANAIDFLNTSKVRTAPCARPLREVFIDYNGNMFPCCEFFPDDPKNEKYIVGHLSFKSMFDIYASKILAKWRKDLFTFNPKTTPCNNCVDVDFSDSHSLEKRETMLKKLAMKGI